MADKGATGREAVGELLTDRMLRLDMNQTALAQRSGISVATIRKIQKGKQQDFELMTLYRLAASVGWDPKELQRRLQGEPPQKDLEDLSMADETEMVSVIRHPSAVPEGQESLAAESGIRLPRDLTTEEQEQLQFSIDATTAMLRARRGG